MPEFGRIAEPRNAKRKLLVVADDFGIGPGTSTGILELAQKGCLSASALLVNSPYAEQAVMAWKRAGKPIAMGWHACLTLDAPVAPANLVPSLVDKQGKFHRLKEFFSRLIWGTVDLLHVEIELNAQLQRYQDLVGELPGFANGHHHIHIFPLVDQVFNRLTDRLEPLPMIRRMVEPMSTLLGVSGARLKRLVLSTMAWFASQGRRPWIDEPRYMVGVGNAPQIPRPEVWLRELATTNIEYLELMCHPGRFDDTLIEREGPTGTLWQTQRQREYEILLQLPSILQTVGWEIARPVEITANATLRSAA